jgi:glycosyltransferase involved in cell wall biosynthesis
MKIIHILLGKANPDTMNGVNKVVHFLATEQLRAGHDVEVWGITPSSKPPSHSHKYSLRVFPVTKLRFPLSAQLKEAINRLEPEVWVQMHSVFIPEFSGIAKSLSKRKIRYGITPHGAYAPGSLSKNQFAKQLYLALFETRLLENATLVHAIGESEIDHIHRISSKAKIILVPNGQDFEFLRGFISRHTQTSRPVFGYCGRFSAVHKGLDLLIDGFSLYRKQGGKGVLWLVGDGLDLASMEEKVKKYDLVDDVIFYGVRFGQEKLQLLDDMDVFIHTSRWDGMPTGCLEAAAMGKPLLISEATNMDKFVNKYHSGWVLPSNDIKSISEALRDSEEMYVTGKIKEKSANAFKMAEAEFSWKTVSEKLIKEWSYAS